MRRIHSALLVTALGVTAAQCGGGGSPTNPPPVPTTTVPAQPSPSPVATPTPEPSPVSATCNLAPGPVARLAISPWRILLEGGDQADVRVRVLPGWDEVVCLDRNINYRLDIQATQKNAEGRECCYKGTFIWRKTDNSGLVSAESPRTPEGSIYRYNITPRGRDGTLSVQAELDGILSHPWQSGAGYNQEPLRIETMNAGQITRECNCIYKGNGVYQGGGCPKAP